MKLKNLAVGPDDRLSKFINYVNNINFDNNRYKEKIIIINDGNFYISAFNVNTPEREKEIKDTIIDFVKKYWKNFESGIDFHRYDGDYFIEIKNEPGNTYFFTIESMDDDFYCKFNSDFIVNL